MNKFFKALTAPTPAPKPTKGALRRQALKAQSGARMVELTEWEQFWYVLMCIPFGAGYFAKIPVKKALSELPWPAVRAEDGAAG